MNGYNNLLAELNLTEEQVQQDIKSRDVIETEGPFKIKDSSIAGKGVFAERDFSKGEIIGVAAIDGVRTSLGRWVNHSDEKNAQVFPEDAGSVYAIKDIPKGAEILYDYRDTIYTPEQKVCRFIHKSTIEEVEASERKLIDSGVDRAEEVNTPGNFVIEKLCNGLYSKVLMIPKGMYLTGRIHKDDYIDLMISGDMTVKAFNADGTVEETERITGMKYYEGKKGRKRVGIAHEDTIWVTVDKTSATENFLDETTVFSMMDYSKLIEDKKCQA